MTRYSRIVALVLLAAVSATAGWSQSSGRTSPKPLAMPSPQYPESLANTGKDGTATIEFTVQLDGTVNNPIVRSADDPAFAEAALAVLPQWRFEPGKIDGKPAPIKVALPFKFTAPPDQRINATLGRQVFIDLPEEAIPAAEYRGSTAPLNSPRVPYPRSFSGSGRTESVEVEFVITPQGLAVNPTVVGEVPPDFAALAILHIGRLVFEPPVKDGKPVYVRAHQTVRFAERVEAPEAK